MDKLVRMGGGYAGKGLSLCRAEDLVLAGQPVAAQLENLRIDITRAGTHHGAKLSSSAACDLQNPAIFRVETVGLRLDHGSETLRHLHFDLFDRQVQLPAFGGA